MSTHPGNSCSDPAARGSRRPGRRGHPCGVWVDPRWQDVECPAKLKQYCVGEVLSDTPAGGRDSACLMAAVSFSRSSEVRTTRDPPPQGVWVWAEPGCTRPGERVVAYASPHHGLKRGSDPHACSIVNGTGAYS